MRAPTLKDFDHYVTSWMGGGPPMFPLKGGSDEYYTTSSGHHLVHEIKIPVLALNATDDPIVAEYPLEDIARSTHVVQLLTSFGGHLGWFEGGSFGGLQRFGGPPPRWVRKPVLEWLQATGEDLAKEWDQRGAGRVMGKNGFWHEEGKPAVGYKMLVRAKQVKKPTGLDARLQSAGSI
jgi:hypothetical protein